MSGDHNQYQKDKSYLDFECPRCGHCCTDDYERGFVDGMQRQMQSSVDKALNEKREPHDLAKVGEVGVWGEWQGLTDEEVSEIIDREIGFNSCYGPEEKFARAVEQALKEKNHGH